MNYISVGAVVAARSRVVVEAWALNAAEDAFLTVWVGEFHFEYRGMEPAIASYISGVAGGRVTAMRFSIQGVDESDTTVLGTWKAGEGYRDHV